MNTNIELELQALITIREGMLAENQHRVSNQVSAMYGKPMKLNVGREPGRRTMSVG